ncbi:hypothetical protein PVAP13_4KG122800 [Panicum virgatum]|uniref:Uncharacterized protein n=1 Tax=Panicum virgatum TaxID=38727 RepID=A0A8T0TP72_PANVG|nr:hypothetical protein PVAP13_4KG122800 [Panicum virgatum]
MERRAIWRTLSSSMTIVDFRRGPLEAYLPHNENNDDSKMICEDNFKNVYKLFCG